MTHAYRTREQYSGRAVAAGEKIARLLVAEKLTYQEADDALTCAQEALLATVPEFPQKGD